MQSASSSECPKAARRFRDHRLRDTENPEMYSDRRGNYASCMNKTVSLCCFNKCKTPLEYSWRLAGGSFCRCARCSGLSTWKSLKSPVENAPLFAKTSVLDRATLQSIMKHSSRYQTLFLIFIQSYWGIMMNWRALVENTVSTKIKKKVLSENVWIPSR